MGWEQKIAQARAGPAQQGQQRHHHRKEPNRAQADRDRHFEQRGAATERRDQNHLRRRRPYQHRRQR